MVNMLAFNFAFADNADVNSEAGNVETVNTEETQTDNESSVPFEAEGTANIDTEKIEEEIDTIAQQGESLIYTVIEKVSDISLPICSLLILWGAVLYFILGIRNLYKKRQGLLLMWGAFTFVVIAKIINFVYWFALVR